MNIALLCATDRGCRMLERLIELANGDHTLIVFSFREEPHEPPFFDKIQALATAGGAKFIEAKTITLGLLEKHEIPPIDILLAVSWRYMVPSPVLKSVKAGAFVIHDSLLPKYRGFSPTVWAIANGETQTGVTLFEMQEHVDQGSIIEQKNVMIGSADTVADVMERLTQEYLSILSSNFHALVAGSYERIAQIEGDATYACKRTVGDNNIDWHLGTTQIYNLIRAVTRPYPGAYTSSGGRRVVIWSAELPTKQRNYVGRIPGRVVEVHCDVGVTVLTGNGELSIKEVQAEDNAPTTADKVFDSLSDTLGI